jgi:hypothetical protein
MPEPADLLHAWEDAIRQLRGVAAPITGQTDAVRKLLEEVLERQVDFERNLVGRVTAPVNGMLDLLEQSAVAMRAQARAFDTAASSFKHAAELLDLQAALLERAHESIHDPVGAAKAAGAAAAGRKKRPAPKKKRA